MVDRDIQGGSGPSGVWSTFGTISSTLTREWTHFDIFIDDPTQAELPPGWIGFGEQDPNSFEPLLPEGATFATVLAGLDEFRISTIEPGFAFGFTTFDVRVDNVSVLTVPEPTTRTRQTTGSIGLLNRKARDEIRLSLKGSEDYVHRFVGRQPSGRIFNELTLTENGKPHNPMINSGAIMRSALIRQDV